MKTSPSILTALAILLFSSSALAMNHGQAHGLTPEKQAVVEKAHQVYAEATAPLKKQLFAKESELNAQIYGEKPDEKRIQALTAEISAINAKMYAEQVTLHRKMAQEGILPEPGHGKKSGMGCPMMGGDGMKHGMMGKKSPGAADGEAAEKAPAAAGHDGH